MAWLLLGLTTLMAVAAVASVAGVSPLLGLDRPSYHLSAAGAAGPYLSRVRWLGRHFAGR